MEFYLNKTTVFVALGCAVLFGSLHTSAFAQQSIVPIDDPIRDSFEAIVSDPRVSEALANIEARERR